MNLVSVLTVKRRKTRRRLVTLLFIITGLLSVTFGVITFYGYNAGNFVMSIDNEAYRRGIILSNSLDFAKSGPRLTAKPVSDVKDITYNWLKLKEIEETEGSYLDSEYGYVAHTFYLMNNGTETVDITYKIEIIDHKNDLAKGLRILIIENGVQTLYQLEDEPDIYGNYPIYPVELQNAEYFLSDVLVLERVIEELRPNQVVKFSYIMWLEGEDPDTTDEILGGMIRLQMNFSINS